VVAQRSNSVQVVGEEEIETVVSIAPKVMAVDEGASRLGRGRLAKALEEAPS
jgi:hypothetical protein